MSVVNNFFGFFIKFISKLFNKFNTFSLKKKIIVIIVAIIILIIGFQIIGNLTKKPPYTTAKVEKTSIIETVSETGSVVTGGKADVRSPTNGAVEKIYVENGDNVIEGQNLFTVQSSATEQEQQAAYSNHLSAQAALNTAESNLNVLRSSMYTDWDIFRSLAIGDEFETGDNKPKEKERLESPSFQIAQDDWLAAEKKYKDQQIVVSQAKAGRGSAWLLYQATLNAIVKAPASGTVSNLSVANGNTVKASYLTLIAEPVLSIANFSTIEVKISLSETDIVKVKPDQIARVEINAISNKTLDGIVKRVDDIGTDAEGVIRYNAYIEITNPDERIHSGMNADVTITTTKLSNVLSVPSSAIKPYQGGRAVRIPKGKDETEFVPVVIGIRGAKKTQVLKGLSEGQEVIVSLSNEKIKRPGLF